MTQNQDKTKKETYVDRIIAALPGHIYWVDRNNIYLGCNNVQAQTLGLNSPKEIVGKTTAELLKDSNQVTSIDTINQQVMATGKLITLEEKASMTEDEGIYLSQKAPIFNDQNEIIGMLGVSFDITERKKMEQELVKAKINAEIANQVKDEFIRNMEHDIRTPIAGIIGICQVLQNLETNSEKQTFLSDIEHASQELINYFNEVLEFSQLEAGMVRVILKKFDLRDLVKTVFEIEVPAAKNRKLELISEYPAHIPDIFIGDKYRMQRILINLVSNAIKFTERGFVKIKVESMTRLEKKEVILKIVIEDTGIGIPEEKQMTLFEKFGRGDPSNRNIYKGQGLGLPIVKKFIQELEGEIEIQSESGKGTHFICYIPLKLPLLEVANQTVNNL